MPQPPADVEESVPPLGVAAALLVALLWGLQFVTSKVGVSAFPPLLFVALRFAFVAALLLPFARRPSRKDLRAAAVLSVFFGSLCFGLFFSGLRLGTAGLSAALSQLMTPFAILFAVPVLGERPQFRVLIGVALAFGGVSVALLGPAGSTPPLAALLITGGAAAQGFGTALLRCLGPVPPMRLLAYMSLFAAPQLALASAMIEHRQLEALHAAPALAWASLAYAVLFGAIAAFGLWFHLVGRYPLARVAPFALLQTPFGIAAGVLVLGEPLSGPLIAGALICMAGVALTQATTDVRPRPMPPSCLDPVQCRSRPR